MAAGYEGQFVVCGAHEVRYPASARCPNCPDPNPKSVHQSPTDRVDVAYAGGEA